MKTLVVESLIGLPFLKFVDGTRAQTALLFAILTQLEGPLGLSAAKSGQDENLSAVADGGAESA